MTLPVYISCWPNGLGIRPGHVPGDLRVRGGRMYREGGKHRFSTVRSADRIYVLNDGYVIESGTHEEPLAAGTYAELHPAGIPYQ